MATTVNITSSYVGHELKPLLTPMFQAMTDVAEKNVVLHDDVNYKKHLRRMRLANIIGDESAVFTPQGTVNQDEVILFPVIKEVNLELDKNQYRSEWSSKRMGKGQMNKKIAKEISDAVVKNILGIVGESLRDAMWVGDTGAGGYVDGFKTILKAAAATSTENTPIVSTFSAFTAVNVLTKLSTILGDYTHKFKSFDKTRIFVSPTVYAFYAEAIGDQSNMRSSVEATPLMYQGYKMVIVPELAADDVIIANRDNLHFGTDVYSDYSKVILKDMSDVNLDDTLRFKQKVAIDVKIGWTSECLIHSTGVVAP